MGNGGKGPTGSQQVEQRLRNQMRSHEGDGLCATEFLCDTGQVIKWIFSQVVTNCVHHPHQVSNFTARGLIFTHSCKQTQ